MARLNSITFCDDCGDRVKLDTEDYDGILVGGECQKCGYYTTRYATGQEPK